MSTPLDASSLDRLFRQSRSRNAWKPEPLPEETWRELYDLVKYAPTSMNLAPARFVFVRSEEVIIGQDMNFFERLPELFPIRPENIAIFQGNRALADVTAFRNSTLQGAYLIMAARALGLDVGPMSGFDNAGVDAAFFAGTAVKSNFLCSIGHGADESFPRLPRLAFEDACRVE